MSENTACRHCDCPLLNDEEVREEVCSECGPLYTDAPVEESVDELLKPKRRARFTDFSREDLEDYE